MRQITIEIKDTDIDIKMAALSALRDAEEEKPGAALARIMAAKYKELINLIEEYSVA